MPGLVSIASTLVGGSLLDRYGAQRVLVGACLAGAAGAFLLAAGRGIGTAAAALGLVGLSNATFFAAQNQSFSQVASGAAAQRMFALNFALLNAGLGVGALVAGAAVDVYRPVTFQLIFLANGISFVTYAVLVTLLRLPTSVVPAGAEPGSYRAALGQPLFRRLVGLSLLVAVGVAQIDSGLPAFVTVTLGLPPRAVAAALVINTVVIVVGQLVVLRRVEGTSRTRSLQVAGLLWALSWLLLGSAGLFGAAAVRWALVLSFGAVFALAETFVAPTVGPLTSAVAPDQLRGRYFAANAFTYAVAFTVAPPVAAAFIEGGAATAWIALLIAGSVLLVVLARLLRRRLNSEQDGVVLVGSAGSIRPE